MALTGSVKVKWVKNTDSDLAGYKVYVGTSPGVYGAPIDVGLTSTPNTPLYTVTNLNSNTTYYFAVTAYDTAVPPNEAVLSSEVQQTVRVNYTGVNFG